MVNRPWGSYEVLCQGEGYKVKRLTILPGQRTSLQKHMFRKEYWTVANGKNKGTQVYVDQEEVHRVSNTGDEPLVLIEVQIGEALSEEDIIRIEDDYGRT